MTRDEIIFYHKIGKAVQKARKKVRLSQNELGAKLGVHRATIAGIEQGRQAISMYKFWQLQKLLKL